jgi:Domain of unknown function (DUF4494)
MATWFLGKIRYQKEEQEGRLKAISEAYLVDAVSFTDAEARIHEVIARTIPEFNITNITRMKLADVFEFEAGEKWFKVKTQFIAFDEKSQKEKKVPHFMLVNAETPLEAYNRVEERLGMITDYEITDVNLTPILEVYPYEVTNEVLKNLRPLKEVLAEQLMEN